MSRFGDRQVISTLDPLLAGESRLIPLGALGSVITEFHHADILPYLRFNLDPSTNTRLDIELACASGVFFVAESLTANAAVFRSTYDLTSPKGDTGVYQISLPFIRLRLTNLVGSNQASLVFYASLSNF